MNVSKSALTTFLDGLISAFLNDSQKNNLELKMLFRLRKCLYKASHAEISDLLKAIDCLILVSVAKLQDYVNVRTVKESSN